jgi:hypothetical protein
MPQYQETPIEGFVAEPILKNWWGIHGILLLLLGGWTNSATRTCDVDLYSRVIHPFACGLQESASRELVQRLAGSYSETYACTGGDVDQRWRLAWQSCSWFLLHSRQVQSKFFMQPITINTRSNPLWHNYPVKILLNQCMELWTAESEDMLYAVNRRIRVHGDSSSYVQSGMARVRI